MNRRPPRPDSPPATSRVLHFLFRVSRRLPLDAFTVRATLPTRPEAARITERLSSALGRVRRHSPLRHAYLRRDLPRILVGPTHNRGECHARAGLCLLQFDYLVAEGATPDDVALLLVHRGTHARLARAGVRYSREQRARVARLCAKAEWVVANRRQNREALRSAERHRAWPVEMWTDQAERDRRADALRRLGIEGRLGYWFGGLVGLWARHRPDRAAERIVEADEGAVGG